MPFYSNFIPLVQMIIMLSVCHLHSPISPAIQDSSMRFHKSQVKVNIVLFASSLGHLEAEQGKYMG
jgi:hypothetical protein